MYVLLEFFVNQSIFERHNNIENSTARGGNKKNKNKKREFVNCLGRNLDFARWRSCFQTSHFKHEYREAKKVTYVNLCSFWKNWRKKKLKNKYVVRRALGGQKMFFPSLIMRTLARLFASFNKVRKILKLMIFFMCLCPSRKTIIIFFFSSRFLSLWNATAHHQKWGENHQSFF